MAAQISSDFQQRVDCISDATEKDFNITSTTCHLCGIIVSGSALKWNGIETIGALMVHLNIECSYVLRYTIKMKHAAENWKQHL